MTEENPDAIVLVDAQGNEVEFLLLGIVDLDLEGEFAMLSPMDQVDAPDDVPMDIYVFHYNVDEDGAETFAPIEDDDLVERVAAVARPQFEMDEGEE